MNTTAYKKMTDLVEDIYDKGLLLGVIKDTADHCITASVMTIDKQVIRTVTFDLTEHTIYDIIDGVDAIRREVLKAYATVKNDKDK